MTLLSICYILHERRQGDKETEILNTTIFSSQKYVSVMSYDPAYSCYVQYPVSALLHFYCARLCVFPFLKRFFFFDVLLTVRLSTILVINPYQANVENMERF